MKHAAAWLILGVVIGGSLYPIMIEAVEYYGKFPPTAAISTLRLNDTVDTQGVEVTALSYDQTIRFESDGTIEFGVGVSAP